MKYPFYYWFSLIPVIIILFLSNYLSSGFMSPAYVGVLGWLVLFIIAIGTGILVNFLFGLKHSIWFMGISTLTVLLISFIILFFQSSWFYVEKFSGEHLIFQITKITFAFLYLLIGSLIFSLFQLTKENIKLKEKVALFEKNIIDAKKEAELIKREALVNSNELIFDAKKKVDELDKRKIEIEAKLREFLNTELAVLERYEKLYKNE